MKILIVGDGKVGYTLAENLSREDNDVTIIDKNPEALRKAKENLDVMCIRGSGVSVSVLLEAGVREADLLIAATSSDEMNMVVTLTGKKLGARRTIARIRDPEYANELSLLKLELGLDLVINPEQSAANEMARILHYPAAVNVESFAKGRVELVEIRMTGDEPIVGMKLRKISSRLLSPILIGAVERDGDVVIPDGECDIRENDILHVVGRTANTVDFCKAMGKCELRIRNVMIVGGGRIAYYLVRMLTNLGLRVKIIEIDRNRCLELAELLPGVLVIQGDGTDADLLQSENLGDMDAFVAMTGRDEDNLILSLMARKAGVRKIIAKVTRMNLAGLVESLELDSIVSPRLITANHILQYVRGIRNATGERIEALHRIVDGKAEILEFLLQERRWYLDTPLKKLGARKGFLVAAIIRNTEVIIPHGDDVLKLHDRVIVFAKTRALNSLDEVFRPGAAP